MQAFAEVKKEILQIISFSTIGNFKEIDNLRYTDFAKWKIAFLYSNERLIPIFNREILVKIVFDFIENDYTSYTGSQLQQIIMANKPTNQNVFEYSYELWFKYSGKDDAESNNNRQCVEKKNTDPQQRGGSSTYEATQKHNEIQNILVEQLRNEYGKDCVFMEKNNIDIKVNHNDGSITYFEVKANSYAAGCIREALGQILLYCHNDKEKKGKYKLVIVGQYPPFDNEKRFIDYIIDILMKVYHSFLSKCTTPAR